MSYRNAMFAQIASTKTSFRSSKMIAGEWECVHDDSSIHVRSCADDELTRACMNTDLSRWSRSMRSDLCENLEAHGPEKQEAGC